MERIPDKPGVDQEGENEEDPSHKPKSPVHPIWTVSPTISDLTGCLLTMVDYLVYIDVAKARGISDIAKTIPVQNETPGWNCQDWILDLLDELERHGILNQEDEEYQEKKAYVKKSQDGLA